MSRTKLVRVKITHPVMLEDRIINPGETIDVPMKLAKEWIDNELAVTETAEATWQPEEQ